MEIRTYRNYLHSKFYVAHTRVTDVARKAVYGARRKNHPFSLDKAQNGIKDNISENWTQKWTAGLVHLLKEV